MAYTNSPLVNYTRLSPNYTKGRKAINTITIHCFVGQVTVERGCEVFANPSRKASCNYVVAKDGKIGLVVEEKNRSWCTGGNLSVNGWTGSMNDYYAVTIEVASDTVAPYNVTPEAYNSLINLVADICKRNNIKQLLWKGDKKLVGNVKEQNMTVHRWFAQKSCPGDCLYNLHYNIAKSVNEKINGGEPANPYFYGGIDYSWVFDPKFYADKYADLKAAFGYDSSKLFNHFLQYGMTEMRQAKADFNVHIYAYNNLDLVMAFGPLSDKTATSYYNHYCEYGHTEGRKAI